MISPPLDAPSEVKVKLNDQEQSPGTFGKSDDAFKITKLSRNDAPPATKTDLIITG